MSAPKSRSELPAWAILPSNRPNPDISDPIFDSAVAANIGIALPMFEKIPTDREPSTKKLPLSVDEAMPSRPISPTTTVPHRLNSSSAIYAVMIFPGMPDATSMTLEIASAIHRSFSARPGMSDAKLNRACPIFPNSCPIPTRSGTIPDSMESIRAPAPPAADMSYTSFATNVSKIPPTCRPIFARSPK